MIVDIIVDPLSVIFDKSISDGYFPDKLKIAQVNPIFKSGDSSRPGNQRLTSILTSIAH